MIVEEDGDERMGQVVEGRHLVLVVVRCAKSGFRRSLTRAWTRCCHAGGRCWRKGSSRVFC